MTYKDYGSQRFITVDTIWQELDNRAKKLRKEIMKEKLLNLANETHDKIAEEVLKGLDPTKMREAVAHLFSEADLREVIKSKKSGK